MRLNLTCLLFLVPLSISQLRAGSVYTPYAFTNFAGAVKSSGITDGLGGAARFDQPSGVATDEANNIYVSDSANTIRKITPSGLVTTLAGTAGLPGASNGLGTNAQFNSPSGLAVDMIGNVYVADSGNHLIRKISALGEVTTLAGSPGQPGSADGANGVARFNNPEGVTVDAAGNIYVADTFNNTVRKITADGVVTTLAGDPSRYGYGDGKGDNAQFASPLGLASDTTGIIYVADSGNNAVRKVTPDGMVTTLAGNPSRYGFTDGTGIGAEFFSPQGVAVDSAGNIFVAEETNDMIRKITPSGVVTTLAGTPSLEGSADGVGSKALFYGPVGVAVDGLGNLYVADSNNARVSRGTQAFLQFRASTGSLSLSNGAFHAWLTGPSDQLIVLETSTDLGQWTAIQTNALPPGGMDVWLPSNASPHRFLRSRFYH